MTPQFVDDAADWTGNAAKDSADFVAGGVASIGGFVAKTAQGGWDLATDPIEEIYAEARRGVGLAQGPGGRDRRFRS